LDHSLIKFGIGGVEHGGEGAWGRLYQYVNYYGVEGEFDCQGVKLFLLVGNQYNPNVEGKNSAIFRKEKFLKAQFRSDTLSGRGTERVTTNMRKLFAAIFLTSNKTDEDIELERRKSELLKEREITPDDKIMKVTDHRMLQKGTSKTEYLATWSRPNTSTKYESKKNATTGKMERVRSVVEDFKTWETYAFLITILDGKEEVDKYKDMHRRVKYRD
jgi:hypothetical protein